MRFSYAISWLIYIFPEWQYVSKKRKPCISYKRSYYVCYCFAAPGNRTLWWCIMTVNATHLIIRPFAWNLIKADNKMFISTLRRYWQFGLCWESTGERRIPYFSNILIPPGMGMSFVSSIYDLSSAFVISVLYAIYAWLWYIMCMQYFTVIHGLPVADRKLRYLPEE